MENWTSNIWGCGGGVDFLFLGLFSKKFETLLFKETGESIEDIGCGVFECFFWHF